jgi:imidazolonepropionase-like amidohydrolase
LARRHHCQASCAPGFDADLLALGRNPLDDLTVPADPKEITHVWKTGSS